MFDRDAWQEILDSLSRHKLRTVLTAFGVFWGIFMLVNLIGVGKGLRNGAEANIGTLKNAVYIWSSRPTSIPYKGLTIGRYVALRDNDLLAIQQKIPEADIIAPKNGYGNQYTVYKNRSDSFELTGITPVEFIAKGYDLLQGRFLNQHDQDFERKNVVIGERVREVLFSDEENPIGKQITVLGIPLTVVGVLSPSALNGWAQRDLSKVFMPHSTLRKTFNQKDRVFSFFVTPKPGFDAFELEQKVIKLLYERHKIHPKDYGVIGSHNSQKNYLKIENLFTGISVFSWIVAVGTIIAGAVGVGNIMLITVKERTREIGIRKALGATPMTIVATIVKESLAITLIAGYTGLFAGVMSLELIDKLASNTKGGMGTFLNPQVSFSTALIALFVLTLAGCLAAWLPAQKAASVDPVIALQDE